MNEINVYQVSKHVNRWERICDGKTFSWFVSSQITPNKFEINPQAITRLSGSGLSSTAKAMFLFVLFNRFGDTTMFLYSTRLASSKFGCSYKTGGKALAELVDHKILSKFVTYIGGNITYQYCLNEPGMWELPQNKYVKENPEFLIANVKF